MRINTGLAFWVFALATAAFSAVADDMVRDRAQSPTASTTPPKQAAPQAKPPEPDLSRLDTETLHNKIDDCISTLKEHQDRYNACVDRNGTDPDCKKLYGIVNQNLRYLERAQAILRWRQARNTVVSPRNTVREPDRNPIDERIARLERRRKKLECEQKQARILDPYWGSLPVPTIGKPRPCPDD